MKDKYKNRLSMHDFAIVDGKVYFSALNTNGLYCYNNDKNTIEFITYFLNENYNVRHLHGAVLEVNRKLYFAPMMGENIGIYDVDTGVIESIDIAEFVGNIKAKFYDILTYGDKIYFIPTRVEAILVLDINSRTIECHNEWIKEIDLSKKSHIPIFKNGSFINENILYMPFGRENMILEVSLEDFTTKKIYIGEDEMGFVDAFFERKTKQIYLLKNACAKLLKYDLDLKEYEEYSLKEDETSCEYPYINMINMGNYIYFVSYQSEKSIQFDKTTCTSNIINLECSEDIEREWNANHYFGRKINNQEFIVANTGDYTFYRIDSNGKINQKLFLEDKNITSRSILHEKGMMRECLECKAQDFLKLVLENNREYKHMKQATNGKKLYSEI